MPSSLVPLIFATALLLFIANSLRRLVLRTRSPLNHLRGPRNESLIFGHFNLLEADYPSLHTTWFEEYGSTMRTAGILSVPQLYTIDLRLVNHVLSHSMDYFRPPEGRKFLTEILGQGVLVTEGQQHKHQRHIMNPAFGPAQIRGFTEIFLEKASRLCDYWSHQIASRDGTLRTDVIIGISKMTLDVIGLAGFNYEFDALNTEKPPNELSVVFQEIFKSPPRMTVSEILKNVIPVLGRIRDNRAKKVAAARATMHRIGMQLLQERKAEIMRKYGETGGAVEKKDVQGRDLLTLLIKANMATDIPDDQRLTDEEVLAQVPTFLVAGNETTSTATAWCLYALCKHPNMQQRLREELLGVPTDAPTMEELNSLPYLDLIVHETLRLHCPITLTSRIAMRDDVLPLSESLADARGNVLNELPILEGQRILIPILALHTSKRIWGPGEDASEFKPERWQNPPKTVSAIPGVWGNLLAFLGGAHACIGYRFSLVEMKAILFMLIRTFEFELSVPAEEVVPIGRFLQRPALHNHRGEGTQLPLLIRPYKRT